MVQLSNGRKKLIVTGGDSDPSSSTTFISSTEILDLTTMQWTWGVSLPNPFVAATSVPYKNTFLVVGGSYTTGVDYNTIYEYDPNTDNWFTRAETLTAGRSYAAAFLVPDEAVNF